MTRYHYILHWPNSKTLTIIPNTGKYEEPCELSFIAGGNAKWYSSYSRQPGSFLQKYMLLVDDSVIAFIDFLSKCIEKFAHTKSCICTATVFTIVKT
jgi:hypothetical protein